MSPPDDVGNLIWNTLFEIWTPVVLFSLCLWDAGYSCPLGLSIRPIPKSRSGHARLGEAAVGDDVTRGQWHQDSE